jgi:hypothetical protein
MLSAMAGHSLARVPAVAALGPGQLLIMLLMLNLVPFGRRPNRTMELTTRFRYQH